MSCNCLHQLNVLKKKWVDLIIFAIILPSCKYALCVNTVVNCYFFSKKKKNLPHKKTLTLRGITTSLKGKNFFITGRIGLQFLELKFSRIVIQVGIITNFSNYLWMSYSAIIKRKSESETINLHFLLSKWYEQKLSKTY